jgi:hypothetical protein
MSRSLRSHVHARSLFTFNQIVKRSLSVGLTLCLFVTTTPAASKTVVDVTKNWQANFAFWLKAHGLPGRLIAPPLQAPEQEKQNQRDTRVRNIRIYPGDLTISVGQRITFGAVAYDDEGNAVGGVKMKWSANDEGRDHAIRFSPHGDFESIAPGKFKITAEGAGKRAYVKVIVVDGPRRSKKEEPIESRPVSTRDLPNETSSKLPNTKGKRHSAHASKATSSMLPDDGGFE